MSAIKPVDVLCSCGWTGTIASCGDCPTCGANASNRVTSVRLAVLQVFARGEFPRLQSTTRKWLRDRKLISVRPMSEQDRQRRVSKSRREWHVTELGARVLAVATMLERRLGAEPRGSTCEP